MGIKIQIGKSNAYLASVIALAKMVYDEKDVSSQEKYLKLYNRCPEAFIFAIDSGTQQLVGYIISLPLDHDYFERTLQPDYDESDLFEDVVKPYRFGNNKIYQFSIVSKPNHPDRMTILKELSCAYIKQLRDFALAGKYVVEASALALSESGVKLCEGMNMDLVAENDKGIIYVNREFHKLFMDTDTKQGILRRLAMNRKLKEKALKTGA